MTFDDDMVRFELISGTVTLTCQNVGLEWPPPERLTALLGTNGEMVDLADPMVRVSMSVITDEQRATMTHVIRGAEYRYEALTERQP